MKSLILFESLNLWSLPYKFGEIVGTSANGLRKMSLLAINRLNSEQQTLGNLIDGSVLILVLNKRSAKRFKKIYPSARVFIVPPGNSKEARQEAVRQLSRIYQQDPFRYIIQDFFTLNSLKKHRAYNNISFGLLDWLDINSDSEFVVLTLFPFLSTLRQEIKSTFTYKIILHKNSIYFSQTYDIKPKNYSVIGYY